MKIYNEIAFDIDGNVIYEDSYEYTGDLIFQMTRTSADDPNIEEPVEEKELWEILGFESKAEYDRQTLAEGAQVQASDVQLNPLPSLPSVSNVGAVAPTGTVNWNAIPGGFQPLPQVAGGRKKLYQLSQFHGGINQKSSPRDIADNECQEAINITFAHIGRIKMLGDMDSATSGISYGTTLNDNRPLSGSGYFIFQSAYNLEDPPVNTAGPYTISAIQNAQNTLIKEDAASTTESLDITNTDNGSYPVYYAAGNGFYAQDGNIHLAAVVGRKCAMLVHRQDINGAVETLDWVVGNALINSPTYDDDSDESNMAVGSVKCEHGTSVAAASVGGTLVGMCYPNGTGTWDGDYYFYISWLFDNGCETGLTSFANDSTSADQNSDGITFSNNALEFNVYIRHDGGASVGTLGNDKRIEGARVYFKKVNTAERFLLVDISLIDGVKGALDSTFIPWASQGSQQYNLTSNIIFTDPPAVYTYDSLNTYYANEVYTKSPDVNANAAAGPTPIDVRYRTSTVASGGIVYIGNVKIDSKIMPDTMMYSVQGKPAVFPKYNVFDPPSSDGTPIHALAAFRDVVLQFKQHSMYVINVSNPGQPYAEAVYADCGVQNQCQVSVCQFGVIIANLHGCFVYDGQKVISLTSGKLSYTDWGISETVTNITDANVPSIGFDPRTQSIIVLKDIGDNSTNDGAWVYDLLTQSWTEGDSFIDNADNSRFSNMVTTTEGYLSFVEYGSSAVNAPRIYQRGNDADKSCAATQTITYWTKDFDFGAPSQTKKLFKVYITYKGDADSLTCAYGVDGETDDTNDLYHFATDSYGGTTDTTPLLDKSSAANLESWHVATLYPDDSTEGKDWKSMSIYMNGSVDDTFEINDISILYRLRPIK
jgi:hypothetical protein